MPHSPPLGISPTPSANSDPPPSPTLNPPSLPSRQGRRINLVAGRPWTYVSNVSRPTITVYAPRGRNTQVAMLVFPGGGYKVLAIDFEGTEVCDWLTQHGITCVLLNYRVPKSGPHKTRPATATSRRTPLTALEDAQRATGLVRARGRSGTSIRTRSA